MFVYIEAAAGVQLTDYTYSAICSFQPWAVLWRGLSLVHVAPFDRNLKRDQD
jgi:hypothetical protein